MFKHKFNFFVPKAIASLLLNCRLLFLIQFMRIKQDVYEMCIILYLQVEKSLLLVFDNMCEKSRM